MHKKWRMKRKISKQLAEERSEKETKETNKRES